ncbi:MAG: hypothetical protein R3B07_15325 [Polyangiaceae bacterium]
MLASLVALTACESPLVVSSFSTPSGGGAGGVSGGAGSGGPMGVGGSELATGGVGGTESDAGGAGGSGSGGPQGLPACELAFPATGIATGSAHTCMTQASGDAFCWGAGVRGQLGDGRNHNSAFPVRVNSAVPFGDIQTLREATCAASGKNVLCWGDNSDWILADSNLGYSSTPVEVVGGVARFAAGDHHVLALLETGALVAWGRDELGETGLGPAGVNSLLAGVSEVMLPRGNVEVLGLAATTHHSCLLGSLGRVLCAGDNSTQQLGTADAGHAFFMPIDSTLPFSSLSLSTDRSCGVSTDGYLYCWGGNAPGYVSGAPETSKEAQKVGAEHDWIEVSAGEKHLCALQRDGRMYCIGDNSWGQLGSAPSPPRTEMEEATPGITYSAVSAGNGFTCGIRSGDAAVICFGLNDVGQLGREPPGSVEPRVVCAR